MHKTKMREREEKHRAAQQALPAEATFKPKINAAKQDEYWNADDDRIIKTLVAQAKEVHTVGVDDGLGYLHDPRASKDVSVFDDTSEEDKFKKDLRQFGYADGDVG